MSNFREYKFNAIEVAEAALEGGFSDCDKIELSIENNILIIRIHETIEKKKPKGGKFAKEAGILCSQKDFQNFLEVKDQDKAALSVYQICGINSRVYLDSDKNAMKAWESLTAEFEFWKRGY